MIKLVLLRFDGVVAHLAPSLTSFVQSLTRIPDFDLDAVVSDFYGVHRPWDSFMPDVLERAGVATGDILDVSGRLEVSLGRAEAWQLYEDAPLALRWMAARQIPVAIMAPQLVPVSAVLDRHGVATARVSVIPGNNFSDVIWEATRQSGVMASEILCVAARLDQDCGDARSAGCLALVMDRQDKLDVSVPNINRLVEIELHI